MEERITGELKEYTDEHRNEDIFIKVKNIMVRFKENTVLDDISYDFLKGRTYGITGNNGSGKTVLMKVICGFIIPDKGYVVVNNKVIGQDIDFPEDTGIIIETPGFLPYMSGFMNLYTLASIRGKIGKQEIYEAMRMVDLDPMSRKKVINYSLGMRQRLGMAQALMEDPKLLVLDEPLNGFDKSGRLMMLEILKGLKKQGNTILISSLNPKDIEALCDEVCEIEGGKIQ